MPKKRGHKRHARTTSRPRFEDGLEELDGLSIPYDGKPLDDRPGRRQHDKIVDKEKLLRRDLVRRKNRSPKGRASRGKKLDYDLY